jgi:tricorn protease
MAGRSVKLRVAKTAAEIVDIITVPISGSAADDLRYTHWEYQTRVKAKELALQQNFKVGYIHMRSMSGATAENAFARGFFGDYDKQGLIIDVRNNHGGNIDSWLLDMLQRKAWMYWESRNANITNGGLGWDEQVRCNTFRSALRILTQPQFAFRGKIVVLINEHTASDGEGFSRGMKTLNLATLVGTRTWGGGIWLSR